jgi:intracellular sulfur oxidation DsrE/DsrF family protein
MRRILVTAFFVLFSAGLVWSQETQYRVVFDLTSSDSLNQRAVMRWVKEITTSNPQAQIEVVMYGKGFELVMPDRSTYIHDVENAVKNPNVAFKVCEVALKNNNVAKSAILNSVGMVPDGIFEIISKQHEGWGYIKVAR